MPAYKLKKKEDDVDSLRVDEQLMCWQGILHSKSWDSPRLNETNPE